MIGVDSPCNGDAWDRNGLDGKTWQNHHRFRLGGAQKERRSVDKRDPKWGAFGSDGDGLGGLGAWIFGGDTNLFDRRQAAKREAQPAQLEEEKREAEPVVVEEDIKREAEPAPLEEEKREARSFGICRVGVNSPCNGDAWDADGLDGKTWDNTHRFKIGN